MDELSVLDLQNLRHLIGGYETTQTAAHAVYPLREVFENDR